MERFYRVPKHFACITVAGMCLALSYTAYRDLVSGSGNWGQIDKPFAQPTQR